MAAAFRVFLVFLPFFFLLFFLGFALADYQDCEQSDYTTMTATCGGINYNFSTLVFSSSQKWFSGPDPFGEYTFYFQPVQGGLPSSLSNCPWSPGWLNGNAVGQSDNQGSCYPCGEVSQQVWMYDDSESPQKIQISFSGGQQGRTSVAYFTCEPSSSAIVFSVRGEIPPGALIYEFDFKYHCACPGSCAGPSPPPPPPSPPSPPPSELLGVWNGNEAGSMCSIVTRFDYGSFGSFDCEGNVYLGVYTVLGENMIVLDYTSFPEGQVSPQTLYFEIGDNVLSLLTLNNQSYAAYNRAFARPYDGIWQGTVSKLPDCSVITQLNGGLFTAYPLNHTSKQVDEVIFGTLETLNGISAVVYSTGNGGVSGAAMACDLTYEDQVLNVSCPTYDLNFQLLKRLDPTILQGTWAGTSQNCSQVAFFNGNTLEMFQTGGDGCSWQGSSNGLFLLNSDTNTMTLKLGFSSSSWASAGTTLVFSYSLNGYTLTLTNEDQALSFVWTYESSS